jgi:5-methylcytosine-specific restriction endonuclease McrA
VRARDPIAARAIARANYAKNKQKIREQAKLRYSKNAEKERAYSAKYRAANKERANAIVRIWRANNPDKAKTIGKRWHNANRDKVRMHRKTRRAKLANAPVNDFTAQQWVALQIAFDHRCAYCHKRHKGRLTQDHVIPLSKGGSHTVSNIVPACSPCNSKKHTGPPPIPVQPIML